MRIYLGNERRECPKRCRSTDAKPDRPVFTVKLLNFFCQGICVFQKCPGQVQDISSRFDSVLIYSFFVRKELHPDLPPAFSYSGLKRAGINAGFQRPPIKFRPPRMLQIALTRIIQSLRSSFSIKNIDGSMMDWHCTIQEKHRKIHLEKRNGFMNLIKTNYSINDDFFNLQAKR